MTSTTVAVKAGANKMVAVITAMMMAAMMMAATMMAAAGQQQNQHEQQQHETSTRPDSSIHRIGAQPTG